MNKSIWIVLLIIILGAGVFLLTRDAKTPSTPAEVNNNSTNSTSTATSTNNGAVKEFTITGDNFKFSMGEMRVKKGDTVKVTFKNVEGRHDWKIDEFNAATKVLQAGQEETIQFVADKSGTFEYYCSVGTHRQMGMKGNLIVE